jgi:tRNA A-37 threonylcarbamoyl transferase component Bud32
MPREQLGRYEIIEKLGHGAMGIVYKARDPLIDRTVAVKALELDLSRAEAEEFERRFYREARSAGRLNHSNIVTIHDVGRSEAVAYIAMEFLQGQSLREILDSGVVLPPEKIVDIVAQVADGLAFAHEHGIVHRDIKPPNIMVLDSGLVKITDFGIALLPTGSRTQTGTVFGSPKYMAPEQVVGTPVDGRADIFSLGAVLYEMLTSVPPFFGGELNAVLYQVINEVPATPSSRNASVAPAFDYIVAKAMAKHPDDRYPDAHAMAADLRNFRELRAPVAVPLAARTLERRAIRRRKGELPGSLGSPVPLATAGVPAVAIDSASRQRRALFAYGIAAAALLALVMAWTMLSKRAPTHVPVADPIAAATPVVPVAAAVGQPATDSAASAATGPATPAAASLAKPTAATPSKPAAPATKPAPVARAMARLTFAVTPWGEIYVDGKKKGVAPPLTELKLAPGRHTIVIRNTTFQPYTQTVQLEAASQLKIRHKFR